MPVVMSLPLSQPSRSQPGLAKLLALLSLTFLLSSLPGLAQAKPHLRVGSQGEEVKELEEELLAMGYLPGDVDGVFDRQTRNAVIAFQKVNDLRRDGVVGEETSEALGHPQLPFPRIIESPNHIEIYKTKQVLYMVRKGMVVRVLPVSTGRSRYPTPEGKFTIYRLAPGWHEVRNRPWDGKMYNSLYFKGAYAIHGSTSVPVYPASHGCVRIPVNDADFLYSQIGIGEDIYIYK